MFESTAFLETSYFELFSESDIGAWILEWAVSPVVRDLAACETHMEQKQTKAV